MSIESLSRLCRVHFARSFIYNSFVLYVTLYCNAMRFDAMQRNVIVNSRTLANRRNSMRSMYYIDSDFVNVFE